MTTTSIESPKKSKASRPKVWDTKYGRRRVKQALPTLEEAIFAAKGITDDLKGQVEIAAELMGMTPDEVRPQVIKAGHTQLRQVSTNSRDPAAGRTFVVEKRVVRRVAVPSRFGS